MAQDERTESLKNILDDYTDKVIPKTYHAWLKVGAHTVDYEHSPGKYPDQSLFWHSVNAAMLSYTFVDYFSSQGVEDWVNARELLAWITLHDLDRSTGRESERKTTLEDVKHAFTELGIGDFCKTLTPEIAQSLINNSHIFKHSHSFKQHLGDERFETLLLLGGMADGLAVIQSPRDVKRVRGNQDRSVYELLKTVITAGKYEFLYHQIDIVSGVFTNTVHASVAEVLGEAVSGLGQLAFFPNGVVYIAPVGGFDRLAESLKNKAAQQEFVQKVVERFYTKSAKTIKDTEQLVDLEKGQPTPSPYAYLFSPRLLFDSIKSYTNGKISRWRAQRAKRAELEAKKDRDKREDKQLERLCNDEEKLVHQLRDEQLSKLLRENATLLESCDLDNSMEVNAVDLRLLSDFASYLVRLGDEYQMAEQFADALAEIAGIDPSLLPRVKVKTSGGVNYKAIMLAYCFLKRRATKSNDTTLPHSLLEQQRVKKEASSARDIATFVSCAIDALTKVFEAADPKTVAVRRREILLEREMLPEEELKGELNTIVSQHLDLNGIRFSDLQLKMGDQVCNFCGRPCFGIKVSAKMTLVDTPATYYSGYNVLTSTDSNPRRLCSLCFFENVLRKVLYPNGGDGLYLFVFPEYIFTPYHAHIFRKQLQEAFAEVAEDEEEIEEISVPTESTALLKAIQSKLRTKPTTFTHETMLPIYVVPIGGKDDLDTWITKLYQLLQLWDGLGLKYCLTSNFYPEIESISDLKGVIELKGAHPVVQSKLKDWVLSVRQQPIIGVPETVLTIRESDQIYKLMSAVEGLASDARQKAHFYADKHSFAAANLYGLSKKKKGG